MFLRAGGAASSAVWQFQKTTHGKDGSVERILGAGSAVYANAEVIVLHWIVFLSELKAKQGKVQLILIFMVCVGTIAMIMVLHTPKYYDKSLSYHIT